MSSDLQKKEEGKLTRLTRAERASVLCPRCSAVLMEGCVLPPGDHELECPVCNSKCRAEISGGTLVKLAALASSAADELMDYAEAKKMALERMREELTRDVQEGRVGDPVTATVLGSHFLAQLLISVAISATVAVGTAVLTRLLTPAQKIQKGSQPRGAGA